MYYKKCQHDPYSEEESKQKDWIKPDSPAHIALIKIIKQTQLMKDMAKMSENVSTAALEVFHSLKIRYLPKSIFYEKEKMVAATELAVMDHNLNVNRAQVSILYIKGRNFRGTKTATRFLD